MWKIDQHTIGKVERMFDELVQGSVFIGQDTNKG